MGTIKLPWPPASLSGHNQGHWRAKYEVTRKHRNWARLATLDAKVSGFREIDHACVVAARDLMRKGLDLKQAANVLRVAWKDLDLSLWRWIGDRS